MVTRYINNKTVIENNFINFQVMFFLSFHKFVTIFIKRKKM